MFAVNMPAQAPFSRTGHALHSDKFVECNLSLGVCADGLVHVLNVDVFAAPIARHDGSAVNKQGRDVAPGHRHHRARHVLVAGRDDNQAVHALAKGDGLDRVGDYLPAYEGCLHALCAHGDAVADGDGAKQERDAAGGPHTFLDLPRLAVEVNVAGCDVRGEVGDCDERLFHVGVVESGRSQHCPRARAVRSVGDGAALFLKVNCDFCCHVNVSVGAELVGQLYQVASVRGITGVRFRREQEPHAWREEGRPTRRLSWISGCQRSVSSWVGLRVVFGVGRVCLFELLSPALFDLRPLLLALVPQVDLGQECGGFLLSVGG